MFNQVYIICAPRPATAGDEQFLSKYMEARSVGEARGVGNLPRHTRAHASSIAR
jgi:hypothetical protein